jgi:hypothetical protein
MKDIILKDKDGRRWLIWNGGGRAVELKAGDPPPKPKKGRKKNA